MIGVASGLAGVNYLGRRPATTGPRAQVLADYGDAYLANFTASASVPAPGGDDEDEVKRGMGSPGEPQA